MVKRCSWGTCNTDDRYPERLEGGIRFITFPKPATNLEKCRRWIRLCGRPQYQLNEDILRDRNKSKHFYVCTKHFIGGEPSDKYPDPVPALPHDHVKQSRPAPKRRHTCTPLGQEPSQKKRKILIETVRVSTDGQHEVEELEHTPTSPSCSDELSDVRDHTYSTITSSKSSTACEANDDSCPHQRTNNLDLLALAAENKELKETIAKLISENEKLIRVNKDLEEQCKKQPHIRCDNMTKDANNDEFKYYTSFSFETFSSIFQFLAPVNEPFEYSKTVSSLKNLSLKDQLLLVMMKCRQNFDFKHISRLFGISPQDCSTVFTNWVNFMFYRCGSVPIWPDRNTIIEKMPPKFREEFPNTLVIIDGTELKIQRPSSLTKQSQFYSDYKSSTTLKGLVGVDPRGSIIFASMLFSGSISDNDITSQSGFLNVLKEMIKAGKINEGDGVMADKGFRIEKDIEKLGLRLNIPPFAPASGQMKSADVSMTEKVAIHRVHVERAIARVKKFKILDNRMDLSLFSSINQIWFVCCFLTNFMPYLIQD